MDNSLLTLFPSLKHPIIMAPMFLVSDSEMIIEATRNGITGAIPALNFRTTEKLEKGLVRIKQNAKGPFGVNLIVNKSNPRYQKQLDTCCKVGVDFIITSLGNPKKTIKKAHLHEIKVFCDVVDAEYAKKVTELGADALIAVNSDAGGHAGNLSSLTLLTKIQEVSSLPIISAGGISSKKKLADSLAQGFAGASIGTLFIASKEAPVSLEYKQACINYNAEDIVKTTKLSGTPCTVINTPYVKKAGTKQSWLEKLLQKNKKVKKLVKMLTCYRGMKSLEKAAFSTTYRSVWCAGPSIKDIEKIKTIQEIVEDLTQIR